MADTVSRDREAVFNGGPEAWKSYLRNNLNFPAGVKLVNTNVVTIVVEALIDEEGKVRDAYVKVPFDKLFDDEALQLVKGSGNWLPAIRYNRKVQTILEVPVFFRQN